MEKLTVSNDGIGNTFLLVQDDCLPVIGMLVSDAESTGTLQGDLQMFQSGGFGTIYSGTDAAVLALRLWDGRYAELTDDGFKALRSLSDEEEAYLGLW